ncbi:hypothetical protein EG346_16905 [Chryseobacterium carnipullorum]|uniref:HK97 gp10 family phage protein n=1 Tax=Chryseobacterium carnipullorum TaxID=1124835 RepID=A0A376DU28_CHRCU|nr:hypothetical protein [Chryseobacterium carnipullorum]AZA49756.1 hypothetical protein EG346_16905 [Chryseobacterium carnipullorum]AZA64647.1 hypothetical protein EG345_07930 [Chryseobacterium carnipullorum]STC95589.1 Uncharacterised protein [Chryseobacterium carnipullorum]
MAVRFIGNMNAINQRFVEAQNEITNKVLRILRYVGEMAINEARAAGSYKDVTGNLRSSVGYSIIIEGKIVEENYSGHAEGVSKGKAKARELASQQVEIALVVVAGMKYASQVESRGRNVLTSAEQLAKTMVPNLVRQLR